MVHPFTEAPAEIPCSQSQKRFWFEAQLDPRNPGLNVAVRWRLEGKVLHAHIEDAWRLIIARHQTLRAAFVTIDGEPHQVIEPDVAFRVQLVDLTEKSDEAAAIEAERLASLEAKKTFDVAQAPLIRVTHVRLRPDVSIILVTAHHAVCDGWSVGILAAEMGEICAALNEGRAPELPELTVTYGDYAAREREWLAAAGGTYREELARQWRGFEQFEILPDKTRPAVQTPNGEIVSELLDRKLTGELADVARKKRCTLFMVAYAALLAVLHRHAGQTDITIGTQFAGRDEVEFERLVGTFVNTVALRTDVGGNPTFDDLLERARDTVTDAFEMRYVPLEELIEIVNPKRDLSRNALLSINFIFQRSFIKNETYGSFKLIDLPSRSAGPICDLNFFMVERPEGWRASCEFNTDLYEPETVDRLLQRWVMMLRAIVRDTTSHVSALPLMTVPLPALSLSSNGKVDRRVLSLPERREKGGAYHGPTEERLGDLLAELLGTKHVDRDVDIFALGFHSLLAMRFIARVQQRFGFKFSIREIFENPTLAALAARIGDSVRSEPAVAPIDTLNPRGLRPPFIFFHADLFADGAYARRIAAALGHNQPVYSVAPHGTAGLPLLPTVEEMARDYIPLIRAVQPTGPYRLGGYCAGGLVAYELARLLRSQGEVVERLVLLNSSPMPTRRIALFDALVRRYGLDKRLAAPLRDRICYNLARLHVAALMGPRVTVGFIAKTLRSLFSARSQAAKSGLEPKPFEKRHGERETENSFAHLVAAFTYHPKPYDGSATLVWADEQETTFDDPTHGWGTVLHVKVKLIGGGHVGAVHERIDDLANVLKNVLGD